MNKFLKIIAAFTLMGLMQSCYWDNEEELYPQAPECDTLNVTYSGTIFQIMENNCNGCHGSAFPQAGIITDNYDDLKVIAENGRFWGAVNHEEGYSPMPKDLPKLNDCDLAKIKVWIDDGALNN